jgi:hypothetical protein
MLLASLLPRLAFAADDDGLRLSFGGGAAARSVAGKWGAAATVETTLAFKNVGLASAGLLAFPDGFDYAYGELGIYLGVSLAAGLGYGSYASPTGRNGGLAEHLFVGVPIPLVARADQLEEKGGFFPYLLPYYRPSWGPWPGVAHELGVMLKISVGLKAVGGKIGG